MRTDNFRFAEIPDDLAQIIDGGTSCLTIKDAIERWKTRHPHGSSHRYWKVKMNSGSPLEVTPMADSEQGARMADNSSLMSAMAVGDEMTIDTNAFVDAQGYMSRSSSSFSVA